MADAATRIDATTNRAAAQKNDLRDNLYRAASLSIIINLDGGAAALLYITGTFDLSTPEVGLLGMLVYFGIGWRQLRAARAEVVLRLVRRKPHLNTAATCLFGIGRASPCSSSSACRSASARDPRRLSGVGMSLRRSDSATRMDLIQAGAPLDIMSG